MVPTLHRELLRSHQELMSRPMFWERTLPHAVARVNLCVLWVGCQLSLLGGKRPIATKRCDRRSAINNSSASREVLNSPGPHARIPPPLIRGYARMC